MDKKEIKVIIDLEVMDFADFMSSLQSGLIAFAKGTKSNIIKADVKEK